MRFDCFGLLLECSDPSPFSFEDLRGHLPIRRADGPARPQHTFSFRFPERNHPGLEAFLDGIPWRRFRSKLGALRETAARARQLVALEAPSYSFVHAGVVVVNGKAVVIAGRSGSGKSRMVEALVASGAAYYSDEYAVFDAQGRVHAFPKPLSLRRSKGRPARTVATADLVRGLLPPVQVGAVVRSRYRKGARFHPKELSSSLAALHLLGNAIAGRSRGPEVFSSLARGVAQARYLASPRGEAARASKALLTALAQPASGV